MKHLSTTRADEVLELRILVELGSERDRKVLTTHLHLVLERGRRNIIAEYGFETLEAKAGVTAADSSASTT